MIVRTFSIDGIVCMAWDTGRGIVTYDIDGTTETNVRPFTTAEANTAALYEKTKASILTMLTGVKVVQDFTNGITATNAQINSNPATYMRAIARELVEVEQNLIAVARLVVGQTESTDTGQ